MMLVGSRRRTKGRKLELPALSLLGVYLRLVSSSDVLGLELVDMLDCVATSGV